MSKDTLVSLGKGETFQDAWVEIVNKMFKTSGLGINGTEATAIPYYYSIVGDLLINPSTVSISTFQRMLQTDDVIGTCMQYISTTIESRIGPYTHPNKDIEASVRKMFKHKLRGGLKALVRFCNTRNWAGLFIGEKKWSFDRNDSMNYITEIIPCPPATMQFRVDGSGRVKDKNGVLQFQFNFMPGVSNTFNYFSSGAPNMVNEFNSSSALTNNYPGMNSGLGYLDPLAAGGDADFPVRTFMVPPYMPKVMDYDKFFHITYDTGAAFWSPYGGSPLRKVYNLWVLKYAVWQLYLIALDRRATPLLVVYADGQKVLYDQADKDKQYPLNAMQVLGDMGQDVHSTSVMVLPSKKGEIYEVDSVDIAGELGIFKDTLDMINSSIRESLTIPGVMGGDSSYAEGAAQGGFFDKIMRSQTEDVTDAIIEQAVRPFIQYNFDESEHDDDWGCFTIRALSLEEQMKYAKIMESASTGGFISSRNLDDCNQVRTVLDFPITDKPPEPMQEPGPQDPGTGDTNMRAAKTKYSNWSDTKI